MMRVVKKGRDKNQKLSQNVCFSTDASKGKYVNISYRISISFKKMPFKFL